MITARGSDKIRLRLVKKREDNKFTNSVIFKTEEEPVPFTRKGVQYFHGLGRKLKEYSKH